MSSAQSSNVRRPNNSPRRAPLALTHVAVNEQRSKSVRRTAKQIANNSHAKIDELEKLLAAFNQMRNAGKLPRSVLTVDERRAKIVAKLQKAREAYNDATRKNEQQRSKTAERSRSAAAKAQQRANNKAKGIVRPKAPVLSANESIAAIQAKSAAKLQKIMAEEAERVAKQIEEARQKAQSSVVKTTKARAELEEKCAALQALKNREARGE